MPLDPSISLQVRPVETPNMLAQYAQVMGIQGAQNQNRLADLQYRNALQAQEDERATQDVFRTYGNDTAAARNALMSQGRYKPAMALDAAEQKRRLDSAQVDEKEVATAIKRLGALSGLIAPLTMDAQLTHEKVMATGRRAEAMGVLKPGWEAQVPMNAMELPGFVKQVALATEEGRKSLEMMLPKMEKVDTGASIGFVNANPLAGQVGATIAGAPVIAKEQSPESRASTGLGYANLAETKAEHGRVAQRAAATMSAGKIPPGYRSTADGSLEAIPGGPASVKDEKKIDDTKKVVDMYVAARDGVMSGLEDSVTGPVLGRAIPFTAKQQIAEGGVAAMAPVLKQLFRVAGEGVFTDRDQALLLDMVPKRTDEPEARKAKMANIDKIVAAKLGMEVPARGAAPAAPKRRASDKTPSGFKVLGVEGK